MKRKKTFRHFDDLGLLLSWQLQNLLKDFPGAACWLGSFPFDRTRADQVIHSDAKQGGELGQILRFERDRTAFPIRVARLRDAQSFRNLRLRKPGLQSGGMKPGTEWRAVVFWWSSCWHGVGIISGM